MSNRFDRGSEWRKWDLHVHTPSSYDYNDDNISNQQIIDIFVTNNIEVVAITDHHRIDTDRIKELQSLGRGKVTILPGIEFCSELGGSKSVHFIGIFGENSDIDDIWIKLQGRCVLSDADRTKRGNQNIVCDLKDTCEFIHELGEITSVHGGTKSNTFEDIKGYLHKNQQKQNSFQII